MLRYEAYEKASDIFGTIVGVAEFDISDLEDIKADSTPVTYKKLSDEIEINNIVCLAIDRNKYVELQKGIYKYNRKRNPKIKEVTIYKKIWKDINGK